MLMFTLYGKENFIVKPAVIMLASVFLLSVGGCVSVGEDSVTVSIPPIPEDITVEEARVQACEKIEELFNGEAIDLGAPPAPNVDVSHAEALLDKITDGSDIYDDMSKVLSDLNNNLDNGYYEAAEQKANDFLRGCKLADR